MNYCGKPPTVQNLIQELQKLDHCALVQVRGSGCYCVILYSR